MKTQTFAGRQLALDTPVVGFMPPRRARIWQRLECPKCGSWVDVHANDPRAAAWCPGQGRHPTTRMVPR